MLQNSKISFIGSGAMATAIISGLHREAVVESANITASDAYQPQLDKISGLFPIQVTQDNLVAIEDKDIIVLAIKPQMFEAVSIQLKGHIPTGAVVLSIMAGVTIDQMTEQLQHEKVVRVMPNTPAQVGEGMSVWTSTPAVTDVQKEQTQQILASLGADIFVEKENHLDIATALSGSGPAYVFLFIEAMIDAGVHLGFSRPVAEKIVQQTVEGSAIYARKSGKHPAELRNMVTSPAGTTAAALAEFEKGAFRAIVSDAIWASYQKSRSLGGKD
ncbi:MAG: pyrroline-5-carboxylate reductase [Chloroflexota bacterium]